MAADEQDKIENTNIEVPDKDVITTSTPTETVEPGNHTEQADTEIGSTRNTDKSNKHDDQEEIIGSQTKERALKLKMSLRTHLLLLQQVLVVPSKVSSML